MWRSRMSMIMAWTARSRSSNSGAGDVPSGIPLDYQAKATSDWHVDGDHIVYDLEARAYNLWTLLPGNYSTLIDTYNNIVSRTPAETTMILILLCLPQEIDQWHEATTDITSLRNCCYWYVAGRRVDG
jgi:hypothetical protein